MGEPTKGTNIPDSSWFILDSAECVDSLESLEELFDQSTDTESVVSNLIDDGDFPDEGPSLALYHQKITEDCNKAIHELKRKYIGSPEAVDQLSPRLKAVEISPKRPSSKRKLFEDSGIGEDNEAANTNETQVESGETGEAGNGADKLIELMHASNRIAYLMAKVKEMFGVPFSELTRTFKSPKTCTADWVIFVYKASEEVLEGSKVLLQAHCVYIELTMQAFSGLYLLQFNSAKCRETVCNLFTTLLNVSERQMLLEPPKTKSMAAALFFYQRGLANSTFTFGSTPDWVAKQTMVQHVMATAADNFNLSEMIQWAWDNEYLEEQDIAYNYALKAAEDSNAAALLKSNNQYKHIRDCCKMVKLYKAYEMKRMSMSEWIQTCCIECKTTGDWKTIANFLKYQEVNVVSFLTHLRVWLKNTPKKNCLCIYGEPNTGKSYFSFSLLRFLKGNVVSFANSRSQFWLQPLKTCKVGLIDDATYQCWLYMDTNLRTGLDGNLVSLDAKHKDPVQQRLPPILITSNLDTSKDPTFKYLQSRITYIHFPNVMPLDNEGNPLYKITNETWKSFFERLARQLDLSFQEEGDESERPNTAFRCTAGTAADNN